MQISCSNVLLTWVLSRIFLLFSFLFFFQKGKENRSLVSLTMPFSSWFPQMGCQPIPNVHSWTELWTRWSQLHTGLCQCMLRTYTVLYKSLGNNQVQSNPYSAELSFGFDYINWITNGPCIFTVFFIPYTRRLVKRVGMHVFLIKQKKFPAENRFD